MLNSQKEPGIKNAGNENAHIPVHEWRSSRRPGLGTSVTEQASQKQILGQG